MGRGRQKAKQQKIARKLKYLTTDTDYDELAKELKGEEPGTESVDPFAGVEGHDEERTSPDSPAESSLPADDLDEYARWAAEAAAKAMHQGMAPRAIQKTIRAGFSRRARATRAAK